ncbi:MAG: glutaredoxin domain-containing protein [Gammaproteobacteria bacterium]|jgi:glutaredoxin
MRNLLILSILVAGGYQLYARYHEQAATAYDENGNPQTLLFTFNGCKPCDDARRLLVKRRIEFAEFNVADGDEQTEKMKHYGGGRYMPYLVTGKRRVSGYNEHEIIGALAEEYGRDLLTREEQKIMSRHFDTAGNPRVVMYATQRCGYCIKAREYFRDAGIAFTELDINSDAVAKRSFNALQAAGTPLIYVGYRRVEGFNKNRLEEALASL